MIPLLIALLMSGALAKPDGQVPVQGRQVPATRIVPSLVGAAHAAFDLPMVGTLLTIRYSGEQSRSIAIGP